MVRTQRTVTGFAVITALTLSAVCTVPVLAAQSLADAAKKAEEARVRADTERAKDQAPAAKARGESPAPAMAPAAPGIGPSTGSDPRQIDVDVNGPHIILRTPAPRDWNNVTVECNGWWAFKVRAVPKMSSLCINAAAFTVKDSVRGDRNYDGVYFDPHAMNVSPKTVRVFANGTAVPLHSATKGMIKPITPQEAAWCVGRVEPGDGKH